MHMLRTNPLPYLSIRTDIARAWLPAIVGIVLQLAQAHLRSFLPPLRVLLKAVLRRAASRKVSSTEVLDDFALIYGTRRKAPSDFALYIINEKEQNRKKEAKSHDTLPKVAPNGSI